jgi:hypothetical protein
MLDAAITSLKSAALGLHQVLNVRLYYVTCTADGNDGLSWRSSLATSLAVHVARCEHNTLGLMRPATSVIPVSRMKFVKGDDLVSDPFLTLQAMAIDPVHMETELWIHHGRE